MSGAPDYSGNPFVPQAPTGFVPAPDPGGLLSGVRQSDPFPQGILLSPEEQGALAAAPQRPPGTEVTVRAKRIPWLMGAKDHMYVEYDDGANQLIARGEPTKQGFGMVTGWLDGSDPVRARVDPAPRSPDYAQGYRTMAKTFLPGVTADEAAAPARARAQSLPGAGNIYDAGTNSNSYAADDAEPLVGYRPGDARTPGYQTHLRYAGPPPPAPLDLIPDLTPALRYPSL